MYSISFTKLDFFLNPKKLCCMLAALLASFCTVRVFLYDWASVARSFIVCTAHFKNVIREINSLWSLWKEEFRKADQSCFGSCQSCRDRLMFPLMLHSVPFCLPGNVYIYLPSVTLYMVNVSSFLQLFIYLHGEKKSTNS